MADRVNAATPIGPDPGVREDHFAGRTGAAPDAERRAGAMPGTGVVGAEGGSFPGPGLDLLVGTILPMIARQAEMRRLADQDLNQRRAEFGVFTGFDHPHGIEAAAEQRQSKTVTGGALTPGGDSAGAAAPIRAAEES
ncbi:hypothetical protein [Nocardia sp. NPDC049526]|uniref:hypothetical protein n=1 Tax=Nocardia sp. NPDC049526 TaxID=3364316 RepID=UPI0037A87551